MGRILIALVALITMETAAHATDTTTTLAAGGLFGGGTQSVAVCYLFNAGAAPVTVTVPQIIEQNAGPLKLTENTCTGVLAGGSICVFFVNPVSNGAAHGCRVNVSGTGTNVRGTLDVRAGTSMVLATEQLR
jgi:hypothetical protein